jgi:hypothetical protein
MMNNTTTVYERPGIVVKYYPSQKTMHIQSQSYKFNETLTKFEQTVKTVLNVDSITTDGPMSRFIKLNDKKTIDDSVREFLQATLAGGEELDDAETMAEDPPPEISPGDNLADQPGAQQESLNICDFFGIKTLNESTYRTAEYWSRLERAAGRDRQKITERDILSLRRMYTVKKKTPTRDVILRDLDKAYRYFMRFVRRVGGDEQAKAFRLKYKNIGDLAASDYSEDTKEKESGMEFDKKDPEENILDFSEFFDKEEDDDYDIER